LTINLPCRAMGGTARCMFDCADKSDFLKEGFLP